MLVVRRALHVQVGFDVACKVISIAILEGPFLLVRTGAFFPFTMQFTCLPPTGALFYSFAINDLLWWLLLYADERCNLCVRRKCVISST